jgi:hypothetical protein
MVTEGGAKVEGGGKITRDDPRNACLMVSLEVDHLSCVGAELADPPGKFGKRRLEGLIEGRLNNEFVGELGTIEHIAQEHDVIKGLALCQLEGSCPTTTVVKRIVLTSAGVIAVTIL